MVTALSSRAHYARYLMSAEDEAIRLELARRVGERLDDEHWLIVGGPRSLAGQLGRLLEQRIFDHEWGGHSPSVMHDEYAPYEDRSVFVVILDRAGTIAAARSIWSPDAEQPTKLEVDLNVANGELRSSLNLSELYGSEALWEMATLAVIPTARKGNAMAWALGELRYQERRISPLTPSVAVVASVFFRMMTCWGLPIRELPGLGPTGCYGVISQPAFIEPGEPPKLRRNGIYRSISEALDSRLRQVGDSGSPIDLRDSVLQPQLNALVLDEL